MLKFKWNGLANLFADLIGKYMDEIDINSLPDPLPYNSKHEDKLLDGGTTKFSLKDEDKMV